MLRCNLRATLEPISTYDSDALSDYFRASVKRPRWWPWLGRLDELNVEVAAGKVKVPKLKEAWRNLTDGQRYAYAAWRWLRPSTDTESPAPSLDDLPSIQRAAGLDHVSPSEFAERLAVECKECAPEHPRLGRWVSRRFALLEYRFRPPLAGTPAHAREALHGHHLALLRAARISASDLGGAAELAGDILTKAMDGAAAEAKRTFGAGECHLSANLMVPLSGHHELLDDEGVAIRNAESAERLWGQEYALGKRLVIVAETKGAKHVGFWVPCTRGGGGEALPGAGAAFEHGEGAAVFRDDLPPLRGFSREMQARWHAHMLSDFGEGLFFSLPFRPSYGASGATAAVLNVNISARDLKPWRRAYHPEWLCAARDGAEPFVAVACQALMLMWSHVDGLRFDTGAPEWDTLFPEQSPQRLLEGSHEDPDDDITR